MRVESKSAVKNSVVRLVAVVVAGVLQVWFLVWMIMYFESGHPWMSTVISWITFAVTLSVFCRNINSAMKIPWIIAIAAFPILGVLLYVLMGRGLNRGIREHFAAIDRMMASYQAQDPDVHRDLEAADPGVRNQFRYIRNTTGMPVWRNTDVTFYPDQADALHDQIEDIRKAKNFIFMEYHAVENGRSFAGLKQALKEKAREGVEVRFFYDDVGSIAFVNRDFIREMREAGIACRDFNPVLPILNVFVNNRDHRKITVIDGKVGYTGGYNLADEYFHLTKPYGYWKDEGVRLEGDAVWNLTLLFLEMWNSMQKGTEYFGVFLERHPYRAKDQGFVMPYGGSPLTKERVAEDVFMNLLRNAKTYCWFVTPYLIITDEMNREMTGAAMRGVDVRIITPGIPDKKMVYKETRSFYPHLADHGVRIFEFTPGFCHAKMALSDDRTAVLGTINLDYRSLYHHFENGVLLYDSGALSGVKKDFEHMFAVSREVTAAYQHMRRTGRLLGMSFLRLVAPLL